MADHSYSTQRPAKVPPPWISSAPRELKKYLPRLIRRHPRFEAIPINDIIEALHDAIRRDSIRHCVIETPTWGSQRPRPSELHVVGNDHILAGRDVISAEGWAHADLHKAVIVARLYTGEKIFLPIRIRWEDIEDWFLPWAHQYLFTRRNREPVPSPHVRIEHQIREMIPERELVMPPLWVGPTKEQQHEGPEAPPPPPPPPKKQRQAIGHLVEAEIRRWLEQHPGRAVNDVLIHLRGPRKIHKTGNKPQSGCFLCQFAPGKWPSESWLRSTATELLGVK